MAEKTERELELELERAELQVALKQTVKALAELEAACSTAPDPLEVDHEARKQARLVLSLAGRFL